MHNMIRCVLASAIAVSVVAAQAVDLDSAKKKVSYTIGVDLGQSIAQIDLDKSLDLEALFSGFTDAYSEKGLALTSEEMDENMKQFAVEQMAVMEKKLQETAKENAEKEKTFLAENAKKEGVQKTESGLQYKVEKAGDGAQPSATDEVTVHYEGRLLDGTVFDSSYERDQPMTFALSDVIPGWTEGLQLMKAGGTYTFYVPSNLAYGEQGAGPIIAPNATLIFKVELLEVISASEETAAAEQAEAAAAEVEDQAEAVVEAVAEKAEAVAEEAAETAKAAAEKVAETTEAVAEKAEATAEKVSD